MSCFIIYIVKGKRNLKLFPKLSCFVKQPLLERLKNKFHHKQNTCKFRYWRQILKAYIEGRYWRQIWKADIEGRYWRQILRADIEGRYWRQKSLKKNTKVKCLWTLTSYFNTTIWIHSRKSLKKTCLVPVKNTKVNCLWTLTSYFNTIWIHSRKSLKKLVLCLSKTLKWIVYEL